jgi:hypothetical protein
VKGDMLELYLKKSEMKLLENICFYSNIDLEILLGLIVGKNRFDRKAVICSDNLKYDWLTEEERNFLYNYP